MSRLLLYQRFNVPSSYDISYAPPQWLTILVEIDTIWGDSARPSTSTHLKGRTWKVSNVSAAVGDVWRSLLDDGRHGVGVGSRRRRGRWEVVGIGGRKFCRRNLLLAVTCSQLQSLVPSLAVTCRHLPSLAVTCRHLQSVDHEYRLSMSSSPKFPCT